MLHIFEGPSKVGFESDLLKYPVKTIFYERAQRLSERLFLT